MSWLKQSTAVTVQMGPFLDATDGVSPEVGLATNMDNASTGIRVSKNGAAMVDRNSSTAPAHDDDGYYRVELDATDTNTLGTLRIQYEESATTTPAFRDFMVVPANVWDSLFGADKLSVDVGEWLGTAVTTSSTTSLPEVDAKSVSDDATAADNLELMYDGTGYTDGTGPASRLQVENIGAASGGAFNFASEDDNTAGGAIKTITFDGVQTTGAYTDTKNENATWHQIDDTANNIDIVYQFDIGGGRTATQVIWKGRLVGTNDELTIEAYNGSSWDVLKTITGQSNSAPSSAADNATETIDIVSDYTGTGADLGKVFVRLQCTSQSNPTIYTDQLLVAAVSNAQSVGYALGAIWVDTNASNTNTEAFVDGVADNPVSTWAAALTLSASTGINRFEVAAGSSITLSASSDSFVINARGATVALGGQSVSGAVIIGAIITGNDDGTNGTPTTYLNCVMGDNVLGLHKLEWCGLGGTTAGVTLAEAGTYDWDRCFSKVAGTGTPKATFTSAANTNLNMRHYSGGIQVEAMGDGASTCNMSLEGWGQFIEGTCTGGTVAMRGNFTTSGVTNLTLSDDARLDISRWNLTSLGNIGIDWANVENPSTAVDLSATDIQLCDTTTTLTTKTGFALSSAADNAIADALLDRTDGVEGGANAMTLRQALRIVLAACAGKADGLATTTVHYRDVNDGANRITATVDANGNRSAVTYDTT